MTDKTSMTDMDAMPLIHQEMMNPSIRYFKQTIPMNHHHFYLTDNIDSTAAFIDMLNVMKTAEEHDTIFMYVNNTGGSISTTIQIISAMRDCKATIITSLEGEACSAATMIFLSGHQFSIHDNCIFMVHYYSQGLIGKGNDLEDNIQFNKIYFLELFNDIYNGFLTEEEITRVIGGKDMWMTSSDVRLRLEALIATRELKVNQLHQENIQETLENVEEYRIELQEKIAEFTKSVDECPEEVEELVKK